LADASAKIKDAAFSQFPRKHEGRDYMGYAMRNDRYRYVEWLDAVTGDVAFRELYDHHNDEAENENVAERPEHARLLVQLGEQMWTTLPKPKFPLAIVRSPTAPNVGESGAVLAWHAQADLALPASRPAGEYHEITFVNSRDDAVELIWIGPDGSQKNYRTLRHDESFRIRTRPGAVWLVRSATEQPVGYFVVESKPGRSAKALIPAR